MERSSALSLVIWYSVRSLSSARSDNKRMISLAVDIWFSRRWSLSPTFCNAFSMISVRYLARMWRESAVVKGRVVLLWFSSRFWRMDSRR